MNLKWPLLLYALYCLPTIIASHRGHPRIATIIPVNLLLGWTVAGWITALKWSLSTTRGAEPRFTGQSHFPMSSKSWLVESICRREIGRRAPQYLSGRLIDIGCGEKPYTSLLAPYVAEHIGVDLPYCRHGTGRADLAGTAYDLPAPDGAFDSAFCTAVLEHLEEPEQALRECFRVLKPGGHALYTVPFIWHLHEEPRDFYRFSKYGLRYLFEKSGFDIVELKALSGFWVTFGQLLAYNLHRLNIGPLRWFRIIDALGLLVQAAALGLEQIDRTERWTWMYLVVARKP